MDPIKKLGLLCLGSRLKRLGERLQQGVQEVIDAYDLPVAAHHYPLMQHLSKVGGRSVNQLATSLGVSQPSITRSVGQLSQARLVQVRIASADGRQRLVSLTPAGRKLLQYSRQLIWPGVEAAVEQCCDGDGTALLKQLEFLEANLTQQKFTRRIEHLVQTANA